MELLGFPDIIQHEIKIISALLNQMTQFGIDYAIEDNTISLKQQHQIKLPDAITPAPSISHNIELLTLDKKPAKKKLKTLEYRNQGEGSTVYGAYAIRNAILASLAR